MKKRLSVKSISDALSRNRGMVAVAARNLGCARSTIYDWMEAHPEIKQVLADEREVMTDIAELSLYKQVQVGEGWAVKYYLSAQAKDRGYAETVNLKHSGDKENPIEVNDASLSTDERVDRLVTLLDAARARRDGSSAPNAVAKRGD